MRWSQKLIFILLFLFYALLSTAAALGQSNLQLTRALFSNEQILSWATEAAITLNSYDYNNYQQQFETAKQKYFTPETWNTYLEGLQSSGNVKEVIEKNLTLTATGNGTPTILQQGVIQNRYSWKAQIPIRVVSSSITGASDEKKFIITMKIERTDANTDGIAIKEYAFSKIK